METYPGLYTPDFEAQVDTLMTVHAAQRDFLDITGMLEKAEDMLIRYRDSSIYHVSLNRTRGILKGGEQMEIVNIRFGERYIDHNGNEHIMSQYVRVAEVYSGAVYACEEFEQAEAMLALGYIHQLKSLRDQGILPGLDDALNSIREPEQGRWEPQY